MIRRFLPLLLLAAPSFASPVCEVVAEGSVLWTGVAVTDDHSVFVNAPRWAPALPWSVARLDDEGEFTPFPDADWQGWQHGTDPAGVFVAVQSVVIGPAGKLWVLDTGNPWFMGLVPGATRLLAFDPESGELVQKIVFAADVLEPTSYLNDVRIDPDHGAAYLTDSNAGGLLVVDLETGGARRVLLGHRSTMAEDIDVVIEGKPWRMGPTRPEVHSDGIAYDRERDLVYWQALTGRTLYRLPGAVLRDPELTDNDLAAKIETVLVHGPVDGIVCDGGGGIWLSDLEGMALRRWSEKDGLQEAASGACGPLPWPDSLAATPDGWIYATTSRIHEGVAPQGPYQVVRVRR
ncbi:MAG: L-dopachrome tautomerase-related protein [Candidatus Krumholzibacteriota bacterium]